MKHFSLKYIPLFVFCIVAHFSYGQTLQELKAAEINSRIQTRDVTLSEYTTLKAQGLLLPGYEYRIDGGRLTPVNLGNNNAGRPASPPSPVPAFLTPCDVLPVQGPTAFNALVDDSPLATVPLQFTFCFYGANYTSLNLSANGNVQFSTNSTSFSSTGFPSNAVNMIAPFWADGESMVSSGGLVYGKIRIDSHPHYMIISWDSLAYFSSHVDKLNSFQLVLTDGTDPILPVGKNVGFYYKKMQWATGDASSGTNGFPTTQPGTPATIGANQGNGVDYFLLGLFGVTGSVYDGPQGNSDGVSWLDGKRFFFDVCPPVGTNQAPASTLIGPCDTMKVCGNDSLIIQDAFIGPELTQTVSVTATAPTLGASFTYSVNSIGNSTSISMAIDGSTAPPGYHIVTINATDNGTPPLTSSQTFVVFVDPTAPNPLNGHIILTPTIGICPGGAATASIVVTGGTPNSYLWSNNAAGTSTSFTITPALDSTVYVTLKSGQCRKTITNYIHVNPVPVANIVGASSLCTGSGSTTVLTATNTLNFAAQAPYTYAWSGTNPPLPTNTQTTTVSNGTYSVTITNRFNCRSSAAFSVVLSTTPIFTVVPSNTTICVGSSGSATIPLNINFNTAPPTNCGLAPTGCASPNIVTLGTGTNANSTTSYPAVYGNFDRNSRHQLLYKASELLAAGVVAGKISNIAFNITTINGATTYPGFTIKIKCTSANAVTTTFDNSGLIQVYQGNANITTGWNTYAFTQAYLWDGVSNLLVDVCNDQTASWSSNSITPYTTTTFNSVAYFAQDNVVACGTTNAATTSTKRPNTRFGNCSSVPSPSDFTYQWSPATGLSSTTVYNPTATLTNSVMYTVVLTPIAATSCTNSNTSTILVFTPATPTITAVGPVCTNAPSFSLTAIPAGGTWSVTASTNSVGVFNPAMASTGRDTVSYTYGGGSCVQTATSSISVEQFIPSTITSTIIPQCNTNPALPLPTTMANTGVWTGTGVSGNNFDPSATGVGNYTLTYSTHSTPTATLCPSSSSIVVNVSSITQPTITAAGPYCDNFATQTMTVNTVAGATGIWGTSTAGSSISPTGDFSPASSIVGTNAITYTLTNGPCTVSTSINVQVIHFISTALTGGVGPFCVYDAATDLQTIAQNMGGTWSGPGVTGTNFTPAAAVVGPNIVTYSVDPAPSGLCPDHTDLTILVNPTPTVTLGTTTPGGCNYPFNADFFTATQNSAGTLVWNFGDNTGTVTGFNPSHIYTTPGSYTVTTTFTSNIGCTTSSTLTTAITVYAVPVAGFNASPDITTVVDGEVVFTNQTSDLGNNIYSWTFVGTDKSTDVNPTYLFTNAGEYFVQLVAIANSPYSCSDTAVVKVTVNPDVVLYVPNTFTPNGDGLNDQFEIFLPPTGVDFSTFSLTIYDRWGAPIYKTNDVSKFWNGARNNSGEVVQQDVYVYKISFQDEKKKYYEKVGYITILSGK